MNFNDFQNRCATTANYSVGCDASGCPTWAYCAMGLTGEAGEVADKAKKIVRDDHGQVRPEVAAAVAKEIGDVLWYCAMMAKEIGYSLEDVASGVLAKLADRHARGAISGSGDNR